MPWVEWTEERRLEAERLNAERRRIYEANRPSVEVIKGYLRTVLQAMPSWPDGDLDLFGQFDRIITPEQSDYLWDWLEEVANFDPLNPKFNRTPGFEGRHFADLREYQNWTDNGIPEPGPGGWEEYRIFFEYNGVKFVWRHGKGCFEYICDLLDPSRLEGPEPNWPSEEYPMKWEEENKVVIE